jgi:nucleotide-binding universal stress UspA family protein
MTEFRGHTTRSAPVIVVGMDGSPASRMALRWALRQAAHSGAAVEAVMAWERRGARGSVVWEPESIRRHPARELHAMVQEARSDVPGAPDVVEVTVTGDAADSLVRATHRADMLVLGSRGQERPAEALVGDVAATCMRHAHCPTVVIPSSAVES